MIRFLAKGLLRDRSRSLFPILVITIGIAIVVLMESYIAGTLGTMYRSTAKFTTGHVKIQSRAAVAENVIGAADLSLLGNQALLANLEKEAPDMNFHERIYFGALLDVPDSKGETRFQSTSLITAIDLLTERNEVHNLNLNKSLQEGRLPEKANEILLGQIFKDYIGLDIGDQITLIGGDIDGGMAVGNFTVVGTVRFGIIAFDRSSLIMDVTGAQEFLAMPDGATDIYGFYKDDQYFYHRPQALVERFNARYSVRAEEFSPQMRMLEQQNQLEDVMVIYSNITGYINGLFVVIMGIVLWNTGLMSGIRRYAEMGVRLAMGETKRHVYYTLLVEAVLVGIVGTLIGTAVGLVPAYFLQEIGFDISQMMGGAQMSIIFEDRIRALITESTFTAGIVPGILAPLFGALISGFGIFRRDTSRLFVELEV
ncbi:MAG: FtsX-like permease family protein [Deltaproteobacteria bacterium]|nr:FtsX-like permease family protein [Deltaproteobacteria bacterium]MBT7712106.1 FtsX-like permease family protein [Deltaproteobacteria bacterium]